MNVKGGEGSIRMIDEDSVVTSRSSTNSTKVVVIQIQNLRQRNPMTFSVLFAYLSMVEGGKSKKRKERTEDEMRRRYDPPQDRMKQTQHNKEQG